MATTVADLMIKMQADVAQLRSDMNEIKREVKSTGDSIESAMTSARHAIEGVFAGFTLHAVIDAFQKATESMAKLKDVAIGTGTTVEQISGLVETFAMKGLGLDQMEGMLNRLSSAMSRTVNDTKESSQQLQAFKAFGIDPRQFDDPVKLLEALSKASGQFQDDMNKNANVAAAFGARGSKAIGDILRIFNEINEHGIQNASRTTEEAEAANRLTDEWTKLSQASLKTRQDISLYLIPIITDVTEEFNKSRKAGLDFVDSVGAALRRFADSDVWQSINKRLEGMVDKMKIEQPWWWRAFQNLGSPSATLGALGNALNPAGVFSAGIGNAQRQAQQQIEARQSQYYQQFLRRDEGNDLQIGAMFPGEDRDGSDWSSGTAKPSMRPASKVPTTPRGRHGPDINKQIEEATNALDRYVGELGKATEYEKALFDVQQGRFRTATEGRKEEYLAAAHVKDLVIAETKAKENYKKVSEEYHRNEMKFFQDYVSGMAEVEAANKKYMILPEKKAQDDIADMVYKLITERENLQAMADQIYKNVATGFISQGQGNRLMDQILGGKGERDKTLSEFEQSVKDTLDGIKQSVDGFGKQTSAQITDMLMGGGGSWKNIFITFSKEVINSVLYNMFFKRAAESASKGLTDLIGGIFGIPGLGGSKPGPSTFTAGAIGLSAGIEDNDAAMGAMLFPKRATGGPVMPGRSYLIGERGPEIFTPGAGGMVSPNGSVGGHTFVTNISAQGAVTRSELAQLMEVRDRALMGQFQDMQQRGQL